MGIGKTGMNQDRDTVSEWHVVLPKGQDRADYVHNCFLSGTVSLVNDNGEYQHRVKVNKRDLQEVTFPTDGKTLGSQVLCLTAPYSGQLYVVAVFATSTEWNDQTESTYRLFKTNGGTAELLVGGQGKILLSVDAEDDASEVRIAVTSKNKRGKLSLSVNGDTVVQTSGATEITSGKSVVVKQKDKTGITSVEINPGEVKVTSRDIKLITSSGGKIYLNNSTEPILLGTKTVQLINDLLEQLSHETAGPYPLTGSAVYAQLIARLETLKSQVAFVE